ncbi:MAG: DUF2804 domain-containing protein [Deltaproteobacteria bacterium]|nr:DUF2804 domain-containing protein [Deltaproteobacteria bacterium]
MTRGTSRVAVKRWQFVGAIREDAVFGAAVADISYSATAFAYVYLCDEKKLIEFGALDPLGRNARLSASSVEGETVFKKSGARFSFENGAGVVRIGGAGGLSADLHFEREGHAPLCGVYRNGLRGFHYTHKAAGFPVHGTVRVDGRVLDFSPDTCLGVFDWSAGCPARRTHWNWASGAGRAVGGETIGINLAAGINETGMTENVFWIGGRPEKVDTVRFDYDPKAREQPWTMASADGKVELEFHPEGERAESTNLILLASEFHQFLGRYRGRLRAGTTTRDVEFYGFAEEHDALW